jgi:methionine synthase II (cobalamin-independent)
MELKTKEDIHDFHFLATGVGSVPSLDVRRTCRNILERFPEMPFWPQFVRRSQVEGMHIQFSEGLPLLELDENRQNLVLSGRDRESRLVTFYEHFFAEDVDYFAVSRDYAPGLHTLIQSIGEGGESPASFLKGQTVGPVTFGASINDKDGKSILYDPDLMEAMVKGLAIKALWQVRALESTGRRPVIFIDEPGLSGFGSAFSSIQRHEVVALIKELIDYLRERSDALIGIHCCGNTDWSMIIEAGPDIVGFDAFGYMDYFFLYPDEISDFLVRGGAIAWGIVPTMGFTGKESVEGLYSRLRDGLDRVAEWGMDPEVLSGRSLLTPACGMGTMEEPSAERALDLLYSLSRRCGPAD